MSIPYHNELFNNGKIRLMFNLSGFKDDIVGEDLKLHFYAIDANGNPIFTEELDVEAIRSLYDHLDSISVIKEASPTSLKFIEKTEEIDTLLRRLSPENIDAVLSLFEKFKSEEKVHGLLSSLSELEMKNLHGAYHHKLVKEEIQNLENMIDLELNDNIVTSIGSYNELAKYSAGQPEKIFQNWIESNLWIFGVDYIRKYDARKIAFSSEADLLMESVDGYLDLIELKRPKKSILKYDDSHSCYYPHQDLSQVIGQSMYYLQKLEDYKLHIEKEYKVKVIMPRIKIIIGNNDSFGEKQNDCLRMLNTRLNSMQILTYNDLVSFGKLQLSNIENG